MSMALRFSRLRRPRICNSCAKVANYELAAGIHTIVVCYDCCRQLADLIRVGTEGDYEVVETDEMHMKEVSHDKNIS